MVRVYQATVRGKTDLGTYFERGNRLYGGNSDNGGLSYVNYNWSDNHNDDIGFRPASQAWLGEAKGIPLGNLTSQVFANIYMNELDQFVKHKLINFG